MWNFLFSLVGHPRPQHFVCIDIGSNTTIRSLLLEKRNGEKRAIKKRSFELPAREREEDLLPLIRAYLRRLLFDFITSARRVPDQVLISLGNHFTFNQMATINQKREHPERVVHPAEFQALLDAFLRENHEKNLGERRYTLMHLMPFRVLVDGYPVDTLTVSNRGRLIEMALFATYAETSFWKILSELTRLWGGIRIKFISNQAAIASAIVGVLGVHDALAIKIGAKMTEVSLLGDDAILSTGQFRYGGDHVTRAIAEKLKRGFAEAERMKRQWGRTLLPAKTTALVAEAMNGAAREWLEKLVHLLENEERFLLPERVYLLGGGSRLAVISDALTRTPWFGKLTFLEELDIQNLNAEDIAAHVFRTTASPLTGPEEVALAAAANRVDQETPFER